ncbi:hypothetical protein, partial [Helicobacter marmotae]
LIEKEKMELPATPSFCHSEGGRSPTEESLQESLVVLFGIFERESLVYKRDSSVVSLPQNDKLTTFAKNPNSNSSPSVRVQNNKLCYPQGKPTHNKHLQRKLSCHSEPSLQRAKNCFQTY